MSKRLDQSQFFIWLQTFWLLICIVIQIQIITWLVIVRTYLLLNWLLRISRNRNAQPRIHSVLLRSDSVQFDSAFCLLFFTFLNVFFYLTHQNIILIWMVLRWLKKLKVISFLLFNILNQNRRLLWMLGEVLLLDGVVLIVLEIMIEFFLREISGYFDLFWDWFGRL